MVPVIQEIVRKPSLSETSSTPIYLYHTGLLHLYIGLNYLPFTFQPNIGRSHSQVIISNYICDIFIKILLVSFLRQHLSNEPNTRQIIISYVTFVTLIVSIQPVSYCARRLFVYADNMTNFQ